MLRKNFLKYVLIVPALAGLFLMASMPVSAQRQAVKKAEAVLLDDKSKEETVVVDKTDHDFGTVKKDGGTVDAVFTIKNNKKVPVLISNVRPACGCTAPDWTKEPIEPGKTGTVTAIYSPSGSGPFTKSVSIIITEGDKTETIVVRIKGTVE